MTVFQAFAGAIGGVFADQWKEIVTAGRFDEFTAVAPGVLRQTNQGRGSNHSGSVGVLSNGSKIFVPEGTAAVVLSDGGIEAIITQPGGYVYQSGQSSVFNGDGIRESIMGQVASRIGFGGQPGEEKRISFVNLREIRGIKFGTRGPLIYNDHYYEADLEVRAFGTFSLRIVDILTFMRSFVPANLSLYSFDSREARQQLISEFVQSFTVALNSLSSTFRISQLPAQAHTIAAQMSAPGAGAGNWPGRFGLQVMSVGIENIEFTPASRELVQEYSRNRMHVKSYDGVSQHSAGVAAQQMMARGVEQHGLGEGGGMVFGANLAQGLAPAAPAHQRSLSFDEQVEAVKKMKELLDAGLLSEDEFTAKKREIMGF